MDCGEDCSGWVASDCAPGTENTTIFKAAASVDVESLGSKMEREEKNGRGSCVVHGAPCNGRRG